MIYRYDPEDFSCDFYKSNTQKSRRYFFNQILKDAKQALNDYRAYSSDDEDDFLLNSYQKDIEVLNKMKDEFIKTGRVSFDSYVGIGVIERTLKDF